MFILDFGQFGLNFCRDSRRQSPWMTVFFRQTESTDVPQFDGHRFRLISGLSLIGSMMDQSATGKSTRSDTLIRTRFVEYPARCLSCRT